MPQALLSLQDIDYPLPPERIAYRPAPNREESRLCVLRDGVLEHRIFRDITDYFSPGDALILNNTRVIPARLFGCRKSGGQVEVFLLEKESDHIWWVMGKPGRALRPGEVLSFNGLTGEVLSLDSENGKRRMRFSASDAVLFAAGSVPLPPYIKREADNEDIHRYQTTYARIEGSVAAPTAGLHFTPALLERIADRGVHIGYVTHHVGLGTFKPVQEEDVSRHRMEEEYFEISENVCDAVNRARGEGRRVFAVGTTTVRALESAVQQELPLCPTAGRTVLFIHPPFEFKVVTALITNFHAPRSTLLLLVSAFAGLEHIRNLYQEAIQREYRFLSYGDATLLFR